mgnify:FL=1
MFSANLVASIKSAERQLIKNNKFKKTFKTFYTDVRPTQPEHYDSDYARYQEKVYLFRDVKDDGDVVLKRTHKPNNKQCCICLEDKSCAGIYFCRVCDANVCSACYNATKKANTHLSRDAWGITPYFNSSEMTQPRCPCCKEEGAFGMKGHKATKLKSIANDVGSKILIGEDIYDDETLKGYVHSYITANNSYFENANAKIVKTIEALEVEVAKVADDERLKALEREVDYKRKQIEEWQKMIDDAYDSITSIRHEGEAIVRDIVLKPEVVNFHTPQEWQISSAFETPNKEVGTALYNGNHHSLLSNFVFRSWTFNHSQMLTQPLLYADLRERQELLMMGRIRPTSKKNTIQDVKNKVSIMSEEEKAEMLAFLTSN